ncbi:TPA: flagellar hook-length control protein FliK [Candidatus Spyradomonas excrementavium]|nr:flagellar hook-length control protein FliK [Candidatus Spyradomonas excrementavium]
MNAQAINFNNLLKATETQAQNAASNVFDASDDKFSKTFNEIVSKYDKNNNNAPVKPQNDAKRKDSPKTENNINKNSAQTPQNPANRKPEARENQENQPAPAQNRNNQDTEAVQQSPVNEANAETEKNDTENTNSAQNEQLTQAETEAILEETALNAINAESAGEVPVQATQTAQISENTADAEEQRALANQKRINNLKTTSTTTVVSISSDSDDTGASKGTAASVTLAEVEEGAQIKASEKVAQAAKDGTISQTQELSSQAKQSAMENLQSIQGTDTTVVESKSSAQSDAQSNSNSSFSQGNAAEQVIKMSIENADADSVMPVQNNPSNHADKALQTASSATSRTFDLNKSDILNQIGTKMQDLPETGQSKVTIILKPEHLGRIQLEILNTGDGITARMLTENQQVKELLDKNMETLKSQLGAQGVNVNNIKVENTQQTSQNAMNFEREQFSQGFSQNPQGHNPANPDSARAYEENNIEFVEDTGEIEPEIAQSQILHDGKVDYKV